MFLSIFSDTEDIRTIAFRFGVSFILAFIIGLERERHNQPAGLRTHVLISIGSTLFMLLSILVPRIFGGQNPSDPSRIAAQIVTGIGFLGAGAILKIGLNVKGLTTAANIWVVSAIGMSVGAGLYLPAFIITGITLITLIFLNKLENAFIEAKETKKLTLWFNGTGFHLKTAEAALSKFKITVMNIDFSESKEKQESELDMTVKIPAETDLELFFHELRELPEMKKFTLNRNLS